MSPKPDALHLSETLDVRLPPRQDIFDRMLVDYPEVQNTLNSGFGGRGSGTWGFQMPATWTRSYRQLQTLLQEFRKLWTEEERAELATHGFAHNRYWHLAEFYLRARRVQRPKMRVTKGRRLEVLVDGKPQFEIVALRHADVRPLAVRSALEWFDGAWSPSFAAQPHHLTGADWERLLNPPKVLLGAA